MSAAEARDLAGALLQDARAEGSSSGISAAEVWIKSGATRSVELEPDGSVSWTRSAEGGFALRLFVDGGSSGFCSQVGLRPDAQARQRAVRAALSGALRRAARSGGLPAGLPAAPAPDGRGLGIFDPRLHAATPGDLEGLLDDAASEALRADPRVRRLDSASLAASSSEILLVNSAGFKGSYRQTLVHMTLGVVAADGVSRVMVRRARTARTMASFSPALFGDATARLATVTLEGRPCAAGVHRALLAPAASVELLRAFARTAAAREPLPGSTCGSRLLTILDDGRLPGGCASAPFDGEGTPTRRTTVVSRGAFAQTLHDRDSAARCGAASTGNGQRASFREPPRRLPSNFFIPPGSDEPEDLLASMGDGLWIQSLRPAPALAPDESIFTGVAAGRRIEAGRPAAAVAGVQVSWPLADLLDGILGVANDLTFGYSAGSFGAPSLLIARLGVLDS